MINRKPTLLQINITANWGSTGKIAESIGLAAINKGWKSYIAYGRWCNASKSQLIKVGGKLDGYLHYGEQRIRDNEGLCSRYATKKLIRKIDNIRPDVIQLHNIHDHFLNYKILFEFLYEKRINVVWTFHDCWAFTGHCCHFITEGCNRWKTGCYECPMSRRAPRTVLDRSKENYELKRQLFGNYENLTIVSVSNWMEEFVNQSFLKNKRIEVIKNGVDLDVFKPVPRDKKNRLRILGVSSIWSKEKGLFDFYDLRERLDNDRFEIILVGLKTDQIKDLPDGINGIERTNSVSELVDLYRTSDVFVNPTYSDTFPTVNLEALACGTPVITYRTGGSPEAVTDDTGWVVEQGDIENVANIIIGLAQNVFDVNVQRQACRARAEREFDKNKCFEQYLSLYEHLMQKK